jgi:MIP family channel proteins
VPRKKNVSAQKEKPGFPPLGLKSIAELLGAFAIVFFGCGAIRLGLDPATVSVVFGLTVAAMIYTLGHLSGAHFNPAVTLAFALVKRFPFGQVGAYWTAQVSGAFAAVFCLFVLMPEKTGFGAVMTRVNPWQTFGWETILTFFLMLVIIAVATDARAEGTMAGAAIGGIVMIGSLVGGPLTGAAMNPARFLAPALAEWNLDLWPAYLAGPFVGAAMAALLYEKIRSLDDPPARIS